MKTRLVLLLSLLLANCMSSLGQQISFKDTIASYNGHKNHINTTGMKILGGWGLVSIGAGAAGYWSNGNDEMKYFSEMNMAWGAVNTGIAAYALTRIKKDRNAKRSFEESYNSYKSNKRIFLINAGLDVVYVGAGIGLSAYAKNAGKDKDMYMGFGKSVVLQGVFLLLFDNIMFSAHHLDNSKWFRIMNEIRFTGNGIGYSHTF